MDALAVALAAGAVLLVALSLVTRGLGPKAPNPKDVAGHGRVVPLSWDFGIELRIRLCRMIGEGGPDHPGSPGLIG